MGYFKKYNAYELPFGRWKPHKPGNKGSRKPTIQYKNAESNVLLRKEEAAYEGAASLNYRGKQSACIKLLNPAIGCRAGYRSSIMNNISNKNQRLKIIVIRRLEGIALRRSMYQTLKRVGF